MARFWVGGANGFLGSHLVELLTQRGHEVVGVSRSGGKLGELVIARVDVLDSRAVAESASGCDGAFLATGRVSRNRDDAEELHRLHVTGTRSALSGLAEAGVKRVVVASTSGTIAVGTDPDQVFDESAPAPLEIISRWPYYRSKYYGEREALSANHPSFEVVIVNPSPTGDVRRFLERSIPAAPAGGMAFVDVRDAAAGLIAAFERGRPGERYLLNAKNLTVVAFLERLERITGVRAPRLPMPRQREIAIGMNKLFSRAVRAIGGEPPVDEVSVEMAQYFWYASSAKAERELGWTLRDPGVTLRDTVDDLIARRAAFPRTDAPTPSLSSVARAVFK
jgi:dihydroflavonol-4-reductase